MDPALTHLHQQQVAAAANAMQQTPGLQQQQQQQQSTPNGTPHHHGPGRPPNADRQVVVDGRRFQRLEESVQKLLELTQLMMNRQEELNDRYVQREQVLQNQVSFTEERLQLAIDSGAHPDGEVEDDDEEEDDEERDPPDMAYPPLGMQFRPNFGAKKPLEGLLDNINLWAKEHGYKCATLRSTQKPGERVRVAIRCALGGEARYKMMDENGETLIRTKSGQLRKPYRKRTSKKTGCQFGFILGETGQGTNIFEERTSGSKVGWKAASSSAVASSAMGYDASLDTQMGLPAVPPPRPHMASSSSAITPSSVYCESAPGSGGYLPAPDTPMEC
ncbi:hypothetical protein VM1G_08537 [Cytospora mali]|uniref:Uncharacterized protein n=1 Tax=Cytospora mali TaxID=578113 RepID=A0A194W9F9_CYTMA|nr:hypothetical protein VM1G_08537 [Valsa mali]